MNAPDPFLDELVSAYVDGQAAPDEIARVEADPALIERARQFAALATAQNMAVPVNNDTRQRHLDTALAAFDELSVTTTHNESTSASSPTAAATATGAVADLSQRRMQKLSRRNQVLGVAAAVALVVMGIAGFMRLSNNTPSRAEFADRPALSTSANDDAMSDTVSDSSTDADALDVGRDPAAASDGVAAPFTVDEEMADDEMAEEEMADDAEMAEEEMADDAEMAEEAPFSADDDSLAAAAEIEPSTPPAAAPAASLDAESDLADASGGSAGAAAAQTSELDLFASADTVCPSVVTRNESSDLARVTATLDCFFVEVEAGRPITIDFNIATTEGDPVFYRYAFDGERFLVITDSRADAFGQPSVQAQTCETIARGDRLPQFTNCQPELHPGFPEAVRG